MSEDYTSFLVCIRKDAAEIYENGLPVGRVVDDTFQPYMRRLPDGSEQPVKPNLQTLARVRDVVRSAITDSIVEAVTGPKQ